MTEKFDPDDRVHRTIKDELMLGIALKEIATFSEVDCALEAAGFEVIEAADRDNREGQGIPWYWPMERQGGALRRTPVGRKALVAGLRMAEMFRLFPKGTASVAPVVGAYGQSLCRGRQNGHIHAALLFPCP